MSYIQDDFQNPIDISFNHINLQVFQLLEDLDVAGHNSSPRGLVTKEGNLATIEIDPYHCIMNFPDRKINWKYLAGEIAWYIKGDTNIDFISKFSSFWKNIAKDGNANSNYGRILFENHPSVKDRYVNQLEWVYDSLVKDSSTRQAVAFFNTPFYQTIDNKDFVCTMYMNFWIRNGYLDMKVQMRSNDIFFGLTFDAPWFSTIMQSMYLNLKKVYPELKLGIYYHCADNIHYYERHFELVDKILTNGLSENSIKLELRQPLFLFEKTPTEGKHKIYMSNSAISFNNLIEDIANSEHFKNDDEYWRTTLEYLYNIS